mmetsp:Transcript_38762/g.53850  ORF Transcript_38762/g.53850 Transcript_38762/m.53850 type:complete len:195 (-) Transcript_38762:23-607(-)
MLRKKTKIPAIMQYVNLDWVQENKSAHVPSDAIPFVSTNDIVTSGLLQCMKMDFAVMAINLRNRIDGVTSDLAGNYENCIIYSAKDCSTPANIRKSLSSPQNWSGDDKTPKFIQSLRCRIPLVTNWATFYKDVLVPESVQMLHFPLTEPGRPGYGSVIIFKPNANTLATLVEVRHSKSMRRIADHRMRGEALLH